MFKLQNQFKIINICLFVFLGMLFINNNKNLYALPGITLEARKAQLEERKIELESQERDLLQTLRNNANNNEIEIIQNIHISLNNIQIQLLATKMEINNITEQLRTNINRVN